ncbi:SDR family oxidoreductase [Gammaproteobacteria bacterium]|nr:SDR family oxidoreductase [Gammaproteobacteria bacterium]
MVIKNIRANSIAPGLVRTDFAKGLWENPDILKAVLQTNPMKRIGEPDEIAGAAIMLASSAGSYINGQTIVIDGGTTIVWNIAYVVVALVSIPNLIALFVLRNEMKNLTNEFIKEN